MSTLTEQLKQVKMERDDLLCEKEASCWTSSQKMEELHYRLTSLSKETEELQESLEVMRQEKQQLQTELEERVETLQTEVGTVFCCNCLQIRIFILMSLVLHRKCCRSSTRNQ